MLLNFEAVMALYTVVGTCTCRMLIFLVETVMLRSLRMILCQQIKHEFVVIGVLFLSDLRYTIYVHQDWNCILGSSG